MGGIDATVNNLVQILHNIGDVGFLFICLQTLIEYVDGIAHITIAINARHVNAGFKLVEHLSGHYLETFPCFVILIDDFLGLSNRCIFSKTCFCNNPA